MLMKAIVLDLLLAPEAGGEWRTLSSPGDSATEKKQYNIAFPLPLIWHECKQMIILRCV